MMRQAKQRRNGQGAVMMATPVPQVNEIIWLRIKVEKALRFMAIRAAIDSFKIDLNFVVNHAILSKALVKSS